MRMPSGIAIIIWDIVLTIVSYFTTTGSIMLDVADLFDDLVDRSKPAMINHHCTVSRQTRAGMTSFNTETFFTS